MFVEEVDGKKNKVNFFNIRADDSECVPDPRDCSMARCVSSRDANDPDFLNSLIKIEYQFCAVEDMKDVDLAKARAHCSWNASVTNSITFEKGSFGSFACCSLIHFIHRQANHVYGICVSRLRAAHCSGQLLFKTQKKI